MDIYPSPIHKSYWAIPGRFRAGEYPGAVQDDEARRRLRWLFDQGINYFIDLTVPGEYELIQYEHILGITCDVEKSVAYKRIPIQDFSISSQEEMIEILDTIDWSLSTDKKIYLHCFGGKGRTGTVVGCFLVRHGMKGDNALEMILELRRHLTDGSRRSPETELQRRMVKEWIKGQ